MNTFVPSIQQQAVFDFAVNSPSTSAFVEAVAGAGKTTTLIHLCRILKGRTVAFLAYNTKIAAEIGTRLKDAKLGYVFSATFHSVCLRSLRRVYRKTEVKGDKLERKFDLMIEADPRFNDYKSIVVTLVELAKQRGIGIFSQIDDRSAWFEIIDHFDLSSEVPEDVKISMDKVVDIATRLLVWSNSVADKLIDFHDMIYIPLLMGMTFDKYDDVLIDEAQDTNPVRRAVVRAMLKPRGRAIFVGDRHQAIYGFTGADNDAIDLIVKEFSAVTLPLTVTYRCPKTVVAEAQAYVSHIQAHESAPDGIVRDVASYEDFLLNEKLTVTDVILCRNTAPIVSLAFSLIRRGIACKVEGRDIGGGLLKLLHRWKKVKNTATLINKLNDYRDREITKLVAKKMDTVAAALNDRIDTLIILAEQTSTLQELEAKILDLFADADKLAKPVLILSTVHRSKGREWDRVFVLGQDKFMPSPWARTTWQQEQEINLIYVAYTRAKKELVMVPAPPDKEREEA